MGVVILRYTGAALFFLDNKLKCDVFILSGSLVLYRTSRRVYVYVFSFVTRLLTVLVLSKLKK